jgi:hypothetical protein
MAKGAVRRTALWLRLWFYIIQGFTNAKDLLVKGAMNAARLCKLRNGVKKTPQFLPFSMEKGEPSAQWISPQLSKLTAQLAIEKKEALSCFKGLSLDGGRANFAKTPTRRFL